MKAQKILVVLIAAAVFMLAACTPATPSQIVPSETPSTSSQVTPSDLPASPTPQIEPTTSPSMSLEPSSWLLESLDGQPLISGTQVTLNFENNRMSGRDGCNLYGGAYKTEGDRITVDESMISTQMACEETIMNQATAYLTALSQAATYHVTGKQLTLMNKEGKILANFTQTLETTNNDPQNATYIINGQAIALVNGVSEVEAAPGSAAMQETRYFGNAVDVDLNGDGAMDSALLLVQTSGGSGEFFYVAAALNTPDGYVGTNAILIGDRIAPQNITLDPDNTAQIIANYNDRKAGEPMSTQPSVGVSRWFKLAGGELVDVTPATPTP